MSRTDRERATVLPSFYYQDEENPNLYHPPINRARQGMQSKLAVATKIGTIFASVGPPDYDPRVLFADDVTEAMRVNLISRIANKLNGISKQDIHDLRGAPPEQPQNTQWLWVGATDNSGRGVIMFNQHLNKVSRLLYELVYVPIPMGYCLNAYSDRVRKDDVNPSKYILRSHVQSAHTGHYQPSTALNNMTDESIEELADLAVQFGCHDHESFWNVFSDDLYDASENDVQAIMRQAGIE